MGKDICAFCGIAEKTVPTDQFYFKSGIHGVLAKPPTSLGHVIVFPEQHVLNLSDLSEKELSEFIRAVGLVELALLTQLRRDRAINLKSGGFEPHLHLHIYAVDQATSWETIKTMFENTAELLPTDQQRQTLLLQLREHLNYADT